MNPKIRITYYAEHPDAAHAWWFDVISADDRGPSLAHGTAGSRDEALEAARAAASERNISLSDVRGSTALAGERSAQP